VPLSFRIEKSYKSSHQTGPQHTENNTFSVRQMRRHNQSKASIRVTQQESYSNAKEYIYSCKLCFYFTERRSNLERQERKGHATLTKFCKQCEYSTSRESKLRRHKSTHMKRRSQICSFCSRNGSTFKTYKCFQNHISIHKVTSRNVHDLSQTQNEEDEIQINKMRVYNALKGILLLT
jgi:hypothetical protein